MVYDTAAERSLDIAIVLDRAHDDIAVQYLSYTTDG